MIYLDNSSTTQIDSAVLCEMMPFLTKEYGNPSSVYNLGSNARGAINNARKQVASLIGADPEQIIFTSGGTESNNMVLHAAVSELSGTGATAAISEIEHDSIYRFADIATRSGNLSFEKIPVDNSGSVILDAKRYQNCRFVSVMHVNNEIGVINSPKSISKWCKDFGAVFHTDCVQSAGVVPVDVGDFGCDFASISSHKIYGPKGVGALYARDPSMIEPMIIGGHGQEYGLRGGTENVAGIVGFGVACELALRNLEKNIITVGKLRRSFLNGLIFYSKQYAMDRFLHINNDESKCVNKIISIRYDNIDAETMILMLNARGICVSAGSACRSREQVPSRVLLAIGLDESQARESIRISFSRTNTVDDVSEAARIIANTAFQLRDLVAR